MRVSKELARPARLGTIRHFRTLARRHARVLPATSFEQRFPYMLKVIFPRMFQAVLRVITRQVVLARQLDFWRRM